MRQQKQQVKQAVDKNKKVRMSKWHVIPLDADQLMYAAIDVYVRLSFNSCVFKNFK